MTAREVFESALIETSKVNAPSLLLSEFNYLINKAINNYINLRYNIYDINQQTTDDIRVLKSTAILSVENGSLKKAYDPESDSTYKGHSSIPATSYLSMATPQISHLQGATYEGILPPDYLHLLNCICVYRVNKTHKCYDGGSYVPFAAKRLTSDSWSTIINDYYNRPTPERPYYYIHNVNSLNELPTNGVVYDLYGNYVKGTDIVGVYNVTTNAKETPEGEGGYKLLSNDGSNLPRAYQVAGDDVYSTVERPTGQRRSNPSGVRLEIRYGKDDSIFELVEVAVDYIKSPLFIRLTQEQMDKTEDTSQILEFPDYVCQEIINELAKLIMVRTGDPIAPNFIQVSQTIANPAQALSQQQS